MTTAHRDRFRELHTGGTFVMPNAWDVGSALVLQGLGFPAVATTSSGFAQSIGKDDQTTTLEEVLGHVAALTAVLQVPLSVDSERLYAVAPGDVGRAVDLLADVGAAGCSVEDWDPQAEAVEELEAAVERVGVAAEAAHRHGMVLTARAERQLYDPEADLEDTLERLRAYRTAGADCVYAPGIRTPEDIARVVAATDAPVNVLALPGVPAVPELTELGVRRVSTGGALARRAYEDLGRLAGELQTSGTYPYL